MRWRIDNDIDNILAVSTSGSTFLLLEHECSTVIKNKCEPLNIENYMQPACAMHIKYKLAERKLRFSYDGF